MAQILVRATVTTDGFCAGWVGYVDDTDPAVQELIAGGYLTTNVTVLPPPVELCCLPPGGTTNQILAKVSDLDRDANWQNAPPSLPAGPASGVLSGTYPNPIFAEDMATQIELDAAIAGVPEQAQDAVAAMIAAGTQTGLTASYNDAANSLSFTVPAAYSDEQAQDAAAAMIAAGTQTGITFTYNDAAGTLSATVTGAPPSGTAGGVLTGTYPNPTFAASPAFTGNPTAPTPSVGDNDTSIATTAFVRSELPFRNVKDYGAVGDGVTNDTAAIQAALDAAAVSGAANKIPVYLPAGTFMISNLLINANVILQGASMSVTKLKRITGSTGIALRERTSAEGNASGAGGIWLRDFHIDGNATAGDGFNIGNQVGGAQLNFLAGMENLGALQLPQRHRVHHQHERRQEQLSLVELEPEGLRDQWWRKFLGRHLGGEQHGHGCRDRVDWRHVHPHPDRECRCGEAGRGHRQREPAARRLRQSWWGWDRPRRRTPRHAQPCDGPVDHDELEHVHARRLPDDGCAGYRLVADADPRVV